MPKRRWLQFAMVCCVLFSSAIPAQNDKESEKEKAENAADIEAVQMQIGRALYEFDLNQQQKYIIDLNFSALHAMSAYSEILLWVEAQGAEYAQRNDLFTMVREAMRAHLQFSAAGVPLSDWEGAGQPISVPYEASLPRYSVKQDPEDPGTFKWRNENGEGRISPISIGQSIRAKSLFLYMTATEKDKAFTRLLLTSLLEELAILTNDLFLSEQLGEIEKGAYVPDVIARTEAGDWEVEDERSVLLSQLSMVQGLARLHQLLNSEKGAQLLKGVSIAGKSAKEWKKLARKTVGIVYASLVKNHHDKASGSFFDTFKQGKKEKKLIGLRDANAAVVVMNLVRQMMPVKSNISKSAHRRLLSQAKFVQEKIVGNEAGLPKSLNITSGYASRALVSTFQMQLSAMAMMLEAYSVSDDSAYIETAEKIYTAMKPTFWSEDAGLYRSAMGYTVSAYDGYLFGQTLRWMEQMNSHLAKLGDFRQQGETMISSVLKYGALLQCEAAANGEVKQLSYVLENELGDAAKRIAKLKKQEQSIAIMEYILSVVDQDGDSVPGCRFGGGDFGTAPVIIMQTSVRTPFPTPTKKNKDGKIVPLTAPGGRL